LSLQPQDQQRRFERVLLVLFLLTLPLSNPWIRGDGVGYYAYVRAPLIEHSLDFTHDYQFANDSFREGRVDENGQIRSEYRTATGHLENHFTVGPGMLWSPFLLLTHGGVLLARWLGAEVPADGFSAPYRYAMAFGTAIYGFLGLWLSFRLARKYVGPVWSFVATVAIWWASSLPVYLYFNPSWSHAHSAFVCALFLWYWDKTREHRTLPQWLLLGLIVGLMLDVYYANLMVLSVLAVEAIGQYLRIFRSGPASRLFPLLTGHFLFGLVVCVAMLPTFVTRAIVYGVLPRCGVSCSPPIMGCWRGRLSWLLRLSDCVCSRFACPRSEFRFLRRSSLYISLFLCIPTGREFPPMATASLLP
jgi:hypothetical protein